MSSSHNIRMSIVVPCYNCEPYLDRCLESLVNQTLDGMEIICVNDGSTDGTLRILREWEQRYPSTIVVISKPNEGAWQARLDGIAKARGEFTGFLDSDDFAEPTFALRLYQAVLAADGDMAVCGFYREDANTGKLLSTEMCTPRKTFKLIEEPGRIIEINTAPWNKAFRTSILKSIPTLETTPPVMEDIMLHLLFYLEAEGRVAFCPQPLVHYQQRGGSITASIDQEKVDATYAAMAEIKRIYTSEKASPELQAALDAVAFLHLGIAMNYRLSFDKNCSLRAAIANSRAFLDENFPTWRSSPYVNLRYVKKHGGSYSKLLIASGMYKAHLMLPFLATYRFITETLHFDIKW